MIRVLSIAALLALSTLDAEACFLFCVTQHRRVHEMAVQPGDPGFCKEVVAAFAEKKPRDLGWYVINLPREKRRQAARCLGER